MLFTEARLAIALCRTIRGRGRLVIVGCVAMLWAAGCGGGGSGPSSEQRSVTTAAPVFTLPSSEPFFPVGMYGPYVPSPEVFGQLRTAGFNTVATFGAGPAYLERYLTACESHALKALVRPGPARAVAHFAEGVHLQNVTALQSAPAVLAWYLVDEPDILGVPPDVVAAGRSDVLELDSQHKVAIVVHMREFYTDYAATTDIFMTDVYPIRSTQFSSVAPVGWGVRDALAATGGTKPVWAVIQAFRGWVWPRLPTPKELRAMTYLAIVQGASGVFFYSYDTGGEFDDMKDQPDFWQAVKDVGAEMSQLMPCLVRPPAGLASMALSPRGAEICCTTRTDGQNSYLIAVNAGPEPASARFRLAARSRTAEVLFEGRRVEAQDGVLHDRFEGFAAHIYRY